MTLGYSFAFWFKLTEALPMAKKQQSVAKGNKTKSDSYCERVTWFNQFFDFILDRAQRKKSLNGKFIAINWSFF